MSAKTTNRLRALWVQEHGIPDGMKIRPQWVNWRYALNEAGKWTKHPYNPRTGRKASSTDLLTWSVFDEVLKAYRGTAGYDGIGFVLCSGDPLTGIDLDGCREPESGEIAEWAAEIVRYFDSYTELSPSSTGVHILVKGKAPASLKRPGLEMYSTERYLTVTGHVVSGIEARP